MTLAEALRREADILRIMQQEHLRLANHKLGEYQASKRIKHLTEAIKAHHRWEFNREKIDWIENLLKEYS